MATPISGCPVPPDQRPLNEYRSLQTSWFYGWSSWNFLSFVKGLLWIGLFGCLLSSPIAAYSFPPKETFSHFLLSTLGGALFGVSLILLRLYLGWLYVHQRLTSPTIAYEETGWYDGQSWTKSEGEITQDHLISEYQVKPILQRLRSCFATLALLCLAGTLIWQVN
jgi:Conserved in the green lineage and diatoms 27